MMNWGQSGGDPIKSLLQCRAMVGVLLAAPLLLWGQLALAQQCPLPPATSEQPCDPLLIAILEDAAQNRLGLAGPNLGQIHATSPEGEVLVPNQIPCVLLKAIAQEESGWQ